MAVIVASLSHWLYVTGHQVRTLFILVFPSTQSPYKWVHQWHEQCLYIG